MEVRPSQTTSLLFDPWRGALVALFVAAVLPLASQYLVHHPDERHYTDAAVWMTQHGDLLTPHTTDGQCRFNKPIVTYWLIAGSYQLLGISPFASRLPFVLLGALVIWFTYDLAWVVCEDRQLARIAACIAACNPLLIGAAGRSIPDVVLCACLAASAVGFAAIVISGRTESRYYWLAYVGTGLAVATKGLPALFWLAFVGEFALRNRWRPMSWRQLVHVPAMLVATLVAGFWFVSIWLLHGGESLGMFFDDQVQSRIRWVMFRPFAFFAGAIGLFWIMSLPWSLPLVTLRRHRAADGGSHDARRQQFGSFVITWSLIVATAMACVSVLSERYAIPLIPLFAVFVADGLQRIDAARLARALGHIGSVLAVVLTVVLVTAAFVQVQLDGNAISLAALMLLLAATVSSVGLMLLRPSWHFRTAIVTFLWLLALPSAYLLVRPFALPDQGMQIARTLNALEMVAQTVEYCGRPALASKVRVCSAGKAQLQRLDCSATQARHNSPVLLVSHEDLIAAGLTKRILYPASTGYRDLEPADLVAATLRGKLREFLEARRQTMVLAVEPEHATPVLQAAVPNRWR